MSHEKKLTENYNITRGLKPLFGYMGIKSEIRRKLLRRRVLEIVS